MKATELRIGNVCEWSTPKLDINIKQLEHIVTAKDIANFEDGKILLEPIPLTDEWLERFGFEDISQDKNRLALRMMINGSDELAFWFSDGFISYQTRGSGFTRKMTWCKYVHQLQNLHFALTGEEIEFKPTGK